MRVRAAVDPDDLRSELATVDLSAHQSQGGKLRCYLEHFAETVRSAVRFQDERFSAAPIECFDVGFLFAGAAPTAVDVSSSIDVSSSMDAAADAGWQRSHHQQRPQAVEHGLG